MAEFRYIAFLSYSHRDRQIAEWLHRELETYRVPKRMIGTATPLGPVPARLHPIFKDREELSAAGSLNTSRSSEGSSGHSRRRSEHCLDASASRTYRKGQDRSCIASRRDTLTSPRGSTRRLATI